MAIQWPQGNTHTPLALTLQSMSGSILDLTGVTPGNIALHVRPAFPLGLSAPLAGTVVSIAQPPSSGQIVYKFAAADVATVGQYLLGGNVSYGTGDVQTLFEQSFVIVPAV